MKKSKTNFKKLKRFIERFRLEQKRQPTFEEMRKFLRGNK